MNWRGGAFFLLACLGLDGLPCCLYCLAREAKNFLKLFKKTLQNYLRFFKMFDIIDLAGIPREKGDKKNMIKFKTTKREILGDGFPVVAVGYCNLQHLLHDVNPIAYTARREGWACDVYKLEKFYIATGYAPFGKSLDYSFLRKFDDKARAILANDFGFEGWDFDSYEKRRAAQKKELARLLKKFEKSVLQEVDAK